MYNLDPLVQPNISLTPYFLVAAKGALMLVQLLHMRHRSIGCRLIEVAVEIIAFFHHRSKRSIE